MSETQPQVRNHTCNLCGEPCSPPGSHPELWGEQGLLDAQVRGGYDSTPGNGTGALDDTEKYSFSLCEFCLDWLFGRFQVPVSVSNYMSGEEHADPWLPAAERVARDRRRRMKKEFEVEHQRRSQARDKPTCEAQYQYRDLELRRAGLDLASLCEQLRGCFQRKGDTDAAAGAKSCADLLRRASRSHKHMAAVEAELADSTALETAVGRPTSSHARGGHRARPARQDGAYLSGDGSIWEHLSGDGSIWEHSESNGNPVLLRNNQRCAWLTEHGDVQVLTTGDIAGIVPAGALRELLSRAAQCAQPLRESLAAYAHASWTGWMRYLFSKGTLNNDGSFTIPPDLVKRWGRQMDTPYADLPESEKASDRTEADRMLSVVHGRQLRQGGKGKERPLVCVARRCKDLPGEWLAHCLTVDVMTQGGSMQDSLAALGEALELCRADDKTRGLDFYERGPAPDEYWSDVTAVPRASNVDAVKGTQLSGAELPPHK